MRAVIIPETGDSKVLRLSDNTPKPAAGPTEVLVKLEYAGVNFIDVYQRTGLYKLELPVIAGREGAGRIEEIGSDVPAEYDLHVGDAVAVFAQGAYAEYIAVAASGVMKLPPNVPVKDGAALMLQGLTAWTMVKDAHEVKPGEQILIQAAAGGTGGLLVQMAKHLGATVIGTVSSEEKAAVAFGHGADYVINYTQSNVLEEVMKITNGAGCHAVLSGIGKATFADDLACTRRKGTFVTYGNSSGAVEGFRPLELSKKNVKLVRPTLGNYITEREEFVTRSQEMLDLVSRGILKVAYGKEYDMNSIGRAQDDLAGKQTTGKLIVKIQ
ncbi:NADPH2:quinone reductase [Capronia coronata CBS 617.96]|uniref:Probable quinone oxidoreductase n=1 Tax=Capronia coronata CBS 617.96 TaxID=1182541 RepID=W9YMF8_9EURO|nr:NADPH2:quinone reductase [Capronia coronata CBS 617.96]EXJ93753.1 NADPH2:quinone reductase [Capronia coronata CBS 617.96]